MNKPNLLGMSLEQLEDFVAGLGEKRFRAQQIFQWIHQRGSDDFASMSNLAKRLRDKLTDAAEIRGPEIIEQQKSTDGTSKWVCELEGGGRVETVLIPVKGRNTLCVSSQVGCAVNCTFCSTGKQGFQRDMTSAEIIGQVWLANRSMGISGNIGHHNINNVVMMGMGEPLLNFEPLLVALKIMKHDFAYGISKRRLTVSTSGIVPMMDRLAREIDVSLAVSLHAPNNELRNELVPINRKYPLEKLIPACRQFLDTLGSKRRIVTIEYVMLDQVNDQPEHARQLAKLLDNLPVKLNLIPFNPFPHAQYDTSKPETILGFQKILRNRGIITTVRATRGDDIDAACGQLVGEVKDRTRRSKQWQQRIALSQHESGTGNE